MARRSLVGILGAALGLGAEQALVNVWDDTSTSNGTLDENIKFLVSTDGQLEVARSNSPHLEVLGGVACEFQHLSSEVLKDSGSVDCSGGANAILRGDSALEEPVNTTHWELQSGPDALGLCWLLGLGDLATLAALSTFSSLACHFKSIIIIWCCFG